MLRRHPFYALPLPVQWPLAVLLAVLAVAPLALIAVEPLLILLAPLFASWGFFATTPLLRRVGFYRYYGPYLCAMWPTRHRLDIHLGTTFDHALTLRLRDAGQVARAELLVGALDGLLAIADDVASGALAPDVVVEGTSWFFTSSTAQRLGFELGAPTWFGRLVPWVIALDITAMYSFTQGRWAWPRFREVRRAFTHGGRLLAEREHLQALRDRLARRLPQA